jgi:drug/metabolite transporter (DMT)-like permease
MPFDYLRLPVVAGIAYLAFGGVPDLWVWLGGAVIAASGLYIVQREARLQPQALPAAAAPETRA